MLSVLPEEVKKSIRHEYLSRLVALALLASGFALGSVAVFLLPAYFTASAELRTLAEENELLSQVSDEHRAMTETVAHTKNLIALFAESDTMPPVLPIISAVVDAQVGGVALRGFNFHKENGTLQVEGVAETRSDLVAFDRALKALSAFSSVSLPIAELARSENIEFTLTATLAEKES